MDHLPQSCMQHCQWCTCCESCCQASPAQASISSSHPAQTDARLFPADLAQQISWEVASTPGSDQNKEQSLNPKLGCVWVLGKLQRAGKATVRWTTRLSSCSCAAPTKAA